VSSAIHERTAPMATTPRHTGPSVSSMVSGGVGIVLLVIGIVALARAGLGDLTSPAVAVGPFVRTPLMGLIELALGVIALATAADRDVRGASALAVVTGVAGIVWLIESAAFAGVLGITAATGWLYLLIAVALLVGVAVDRRRTVA
jgi:hypothetical protein